ncbi:FxSxx-COOH system tetratricopeptide repeat protein [Actinosynnema sp. NPDC051121]
MTEQPPSERTASSPPLIAAFTSPTNGIGRTGVVANLAWLLAAAGNRVAVADWGTEAPRVHDYLSPFLVADVPMREFLDEVVRPRRPGVPAWVHSTYEEELFPSLVVRRCRMPDGAGRLDVVAPADSSSPVRGFAPELGGLGEVERLRDAIRRSDYDFVLVDAPTNMSIDTGSRMARLCDVVAVCFLPLNSAIRQAASIAGEVWDSARVGVRVLAVPLRFDQGDPARAEQNAATVNAAFDRLLSEKADSEGRQMSAAVIPIPYYTHDSHIEALVVVADDDQGTHQDAYRRLAESVAERDVPEVRISEEFLVSYLNAVGLAVPDGPARVSLVHAPEDRGWADWAESQFSLAGVQVTRFTGELPPGATTVVLHSPAYARSDRAKALSRALDRDQNAPVVRVALTDDGVPDEVPGITLVKLGGVTDGTDARARLLAPFPVVPAVSEETVRFPRRDVRPAELPSSPSPFFGRGEEIERIRDDLTAAPGLRTRWISGAAGIGKSELAREYAQRFAFDYEHVWWVRAHDRQSITRSFAGPARKVGVPEGADTTEQVLAWLAACDERSRWLLVYDNADDPDVLRDLVPTGGAGHVLITSRALGPESVHLGLLRPDESSALLLERVRDLPAEAAAEVAGTAGHLPLALHLAACWIDEVAARHRGRGESSAGAASLAAAEFMEAVEAQEAFTPATGTDEAVLGTGRTLRVVQDTLSTRTTGRKVLRVARLCAFLGEEGVALRLLHSPPFLAALAGPGEEAGWDDLELDRVLWSGTRSGLFRVSRKRPGILVVHRLVLTLLREFMTEGERAEWRDEVLRALAAVAPTEAEIDNFDRSDDLRELRAHIVPSGAPVSELPEVRRWLVNQMRFFLLEGDPEAWRFAVELAVGLLDGWAETKQVDLRMRLRFHLANLKRALGQNGEALTLDEGLLDDQRRTLGLHHPRTLRTARSVAQGLRVIGDFYGALTEEHATVRGFRNVLGRDHPDTMRAANNLAFSLYLSGFTEDALAVQQDIREQRLRLLGDGHMDVWWSTCTIGTYLRELGRYPEAMNELLLAGERVASIGSGNPRYELRVEWAKGATQRRMGNDPMVAVEILSDASQRYRKLYGPHHTDTRACLLSFAAAHHAAGDPATAVRLCEQSLQGYQRHHGVFHPFTLLCKLDQAVFLNANGRIEAALRTADEAMEGLRVRLGPVHPWSLAAAANHERIRGAADNVDLAFEQMEAIYEHCLDHLEPEHPVTKVVQGNLHAEPTSWKDVVLDAPEM